MKKVSFSIITCTQNRLESGFLEKCINSIQLQEPADFTFEHILIDDGSTDGTKEYLEKFTKKYSNIKIFTSDKPLGPAKSYEKGISLAKGDFITFLDDDDKLPRDSLKKRTKYITENPEIDWFVARARWIDEKGNLIKGTKRGVPPSEHQYETLLYNNYIHGGTPVVRRSCFKNVEWPEWLTYSQDYFMWLELARPSNDFKLGFLNDFVYYYRRHGKQYTFTFIQSKKVWEEGWLRNERIKRELHPEDLSYLAVILRKLDYRNKQLENEAKKLKRILNENGLKSTYKTKRVSKLLETPKISSASSYRKK
jgi:glycosyltransferase involved in cell wall biosynthesis